MKNAGGASVKSMSPHLICLTGEYVHIMRVYILRMHRQSIHRSTPDRTNNDNQNEKAHKRVMQKGAKQKEGRTHHESSIKQRQHKTKRARDKQPTKPKTPTERIRTGAAQVAAEPRRLS